MPICPRTVRYVATPRGRMCYTCNEAAQVCADETYPTHVIAHGRQGFNEAVASATDGIALSARTAQPSTCFNVAVARATDGVHERGIWR